MCFKNNLILCEDCKKEFNEAVEKNTKKVRRHVLCVNDNYLKMTKNIISPTGSLTRFSENFNTNDYNMVASCEK